MVNRKQFYISWGLGRVLNKKIKEKTTFSTRCAAVSQDSGAPWRSFVVSLELLNSLVKLLQKQTESNKWLIYFLLWSLTPLNPGALCHLSVLLFISSRLYSSFSPFYSVSILLLYIPLPLSCLVILSPTLQLLWVS